MTTFDFNCIFLLLNIKDKKGTAYCAQILCSVIFLKRELHCWGLLKKRKKSTCLFKTICRQLKLWVFQVKSIKSPSSNAWVSNTPCRGTNFCSKIEFGHNFVCEQILIFDQFLTNFWVLKINFFVQNFVFLSWEFGQKLRFLPFWGQNLVDEN